MSSITYDTYETKKLSFGSLEHTDGCYELPLKYGANHFILEGCELVSTRGLEVRKLKDGTMAFFIRCTLDQHNPAHMKFFYTINKFHQDTCDFIRFEHIEYTEVRPLIQFTNNEYVLFLFLRNKDMDQTIFTDQNGKFLSWHTLENRPLKFSPHIHIKKVFVAHKCVNYDTELISAVIY